MKIIGLGYKARNGKDSVANAMIETYGDDIRIKKVSFASTLKREVENMAKAIGSMASLALLFDRAAAANGKAVTYDPYPPMDDPDCPSGKQRSMLQWYGSDFWRKIDTDHWVKALALQMCKADEDVFIVTDVRFTNEADWIRSKGGLMIKVTCPDLPDNLVLKNHMAHISETQLDSYKFDHEIWARFGDMKCLSAQACGLFQNFVLGENQYE